MLKFDFSVNEISSRVLLTESTSLVMSIGLNEGGGEREGGGGGGGDTCTFLVFLTLNKLCSNKAENS